MEAALAAAPGKRDDSHVNIDEERIRAEKLEKERRAREVAMKQKEAKDRDVLLREKEKEILMQMQKDKVEMEKKAKLLEKKKDEEKERRMRELRYGGAVCGCTYIDTKNRLKEFAERQKQAQKNRVSAADPAPVVQRVAPSEKYGILFTNGLMLILCREPRPSSEKRSSNSKAESELEKQRRQIYFDAQAAADRNRRMVWTLLVLSINNLIILL